MIIYYIMYCLEVFLGNLLKGKKSKEGEQAAPKSASGSKFDTKSKDKKKDGQEKFDDINKPYDPKSKYEEKYKEP
jgi:hypothetical protein